MLMEKGRRLFFVLGVPKSGTTWLQQLLDAHPNIICTGEGALHWYLAAMRQGARDYNRHLSARRAIFQKQLFPPLAAREMRRLAHFFVVQRLQSAVGEASASQVDWIGNKDPDHGTNMEVMARLFPRAAYIHIIRDGRDQLVSLWRHMQRHHPKYQPDRFASLDKMLAERGAKWATYIRNVRKVAARARLRYHELRYEDLGAESEATFQSVLNFLAVDASFDVIRNCLSAADFATLSGGRARGEEDVNSFYRKGVAGDWRNHLSNEQSEDFCAASGGLIAELGYEDI